jgi:signal transduction histidine kinase
VAVEANASFFYYQGRPVILTIIRDISERKQAEADLKMSAKKLDELLQKEKIQTRELQEETRARGMFIDVLAHELKTPLTPILASTGMLNDLLRNNKGVQGRLAANVFTSAQVLSNRLDELLEVARYSRGTFKLKREPVETGKYLNAVISRFKPSIDQRGQTLKVEIAQDLPVVEIDQSRFEQVLINLLSNASKFSPQNGHVTFRSRMQGDDLLVEVQDDGIGISTEESLRIFQPYHRVEQDRLKFPGLGLGLAVAKQIAEAHGGRIWIDSELGHGSTFSVTIPVKSTQSNLPSTTG